MKNDLLIKLKGYQLIQNEKNTFGVYYYAVYVEEIFNTVLGEEIISNYKEIYDQIKNKEIKDLNLDEVKSYFTFIRRGERFCDGHISNFLDNGIFTKLFERYLDLC